MKIIILADALVGFELVKFLCSEYRSDVEAVICKSDNSIADFCRKSHVKFKICENTVELERYLAIHAFDLGILAWWPDLISKNSIKTAKLGFINTHNSFLPFGRGKHPYFWAIVEENPFGVSLHWVNDGIDTGDIIAQRPIAVSWTDNSDSVYQRSLSSIVQLFIETYPRIRRGQINSQSQADSGTFHYGSEIEEISEIDLEKCYKARLLINILRARTSDSERFQAAFFWDNDKKYRVKISIVEEPLS